tara:strand:+ start:2576 stop:4906 length:2331 start_codon:yes stop_codon:yes gene_type:complete
MIIKNHMKKIFTLFVLAFTSLFSPFFSQVFDLGGPVSFKLKNELKEDYDVHVMPSFDLAAQLAADQINHSNKIGPYRFGYEHIVNLSIDNSGNWDVLSNGDKIWRLKLISTGALSINLIFNDFFIPDGAHLHLYNSDRSMVLGAYNHLNNNSNNVLGSDLVKGDEIIVEYFQSKDVSLAPRLLIGTVVHGYRDINNWYPVKVNESGACNMDVICPDGIPWSNEIRSVARILVGGGLCTGSLVNNTLQDGTPYFLTANHCGPSSMGSAVFRFNYDSPICGSQTVANSQSSSGNSINGSSFRASKADSDFGLIELNSTPPVSYNVFYSGWDNSGNTPQTAVSIHHPSGDVKKISFDDDPLQSASGLSSVNNSEWRIEAWERLTTTEGGSSGGGLWNENYHLVGQLHGGQASCGNSVNDYYGKFSMSWDGNGSSSASQRLQNWLDPQNSGVTSLDGYDPNQPTLAYDASVTAVSEPSGTYCSNYINPSITIKNNGSNTLTSASIVYDVDGGSSSTYNWTGSLTTGSSATVSLSSMSVSSSGAHTFNVSISSPNGQTDGNQNNNQGSSSFECYPGTAETLLNLTFDCWGSEVSWEIVDQTTSNVLFSAPAGTYSDNAPTGYAVTETLCLSDGCYDFNINDGYGDGMAGAQYNSCDVDGNYTITDPWGSQTYVQMADPDYGNGTSHTFCINNTLVEELDKLNIAVYPNPANNFINLRLLDKSFFDNVNLELFDISGRKLVDYQNIFTADLFTLDVSSFSQGVYSLTLSNGQFTVVERILIK